MGAGGWGSFRALLAGAFGFGNGFLGLLASAGLMAMRLYKVYNWFCCNSTSLVTVDHLSCYKFTNFWFHSGLKVGNIVGLKGPVWVVRVVAMGLAGVG